VKPFLSLILAKAYRINVWDAFFLKNVCDAVFVGDQKTWSGFV
jgi:hypothetical protein